MNSKAAQNTVLFLLSKAFYELFHPHQIVIEHSFGDGFFCHEANWEKMSGKNIKELEVQLINWIKNTTPIEFESRSKHRVQKDLEKMNSQSKLELLRQWDKDTISIIQFGSHWDIQLDVMETDKSLLNIFKLKEYNDGFIIRFQNEGGIFPPFTDQPRLFSIFEEHEKWGSILGVSTIRELNELIRTGKIREMIWVAEGLQEKKISYIADKMVEDFPEKRIISISGPSSSGKTTFAKRLGIQLRVNGFNTIQISMDDYFLDRNDLKPNEDGQIDYETIAAINTDLLCKHLKQLLNGYPVRMRKFDFVSGTSKEAGKTIQLGKWDFILLEGIHGLNPNLTKTVGKKHLHRVYISAITQMNIDANHRISTSDNRLLRRMVRDHKFRGYSSLETLDRWPMVRKGEDENIFPFQEEADFMFNSSLVYELPVLAKYALPLLREIDSRSEFALEAERLMTLLSFFEVFDESWVPGISILREFIGDSDFDY